MSDSWLSLTVGAAIGLISAVIAGHFVNEINRRQRRRLVLRSLRRELKEFVNRLELRPLEPDDLSLVSTINVTLLERAFTDNVWDYAYDSEIIGILADLIERVKRFNENVKVVNTFTFDVWLTEGDRVVEVRQYLHEYVQNSVKDISKLVSDLAAVVDRMLVAPGE